MADSNPPAVAAAAPDSAPASHAAAPTNTTTTTTTTAAATDSSAASQPAAEPAEKQDTTRTEGRPSLEPALPVATAADKEAGGVLPRESGDNDEDVNPPDFQGAVLSNDDLPPHDTIRRIGEYAVLDRYGKTHTFKSLYTGRNVARRVLIIFVRHFYCGVSPSRPFISSTR